MDFFQPTAYLCLLGCSMGEKAAWRSGTSSAKPSMKVQQQVNKSFPFCQGPNWGKGKWKLTKYMCFHQLCLSFQSKTQKCKRLWDDIQMEDWWWACYCICILHSGAEPILSYRLLMLMLWETLSVNQKLTNKLWALKCWLFAIFIFISFILSLWE